MEGLRTARPQRFTSRRAAARLNLPRAARVYGWAVKPLIDRLAALLLLLLLLPLLVGILLALRVSVGKPCIFKQRRVGRHGRVFTMYKFRTMIADRRVSNAPYHGVDRRIAHKVPVDPRVTPLGRQLRKWSLDEVPQLWNVLRGDMSLVGPRPELVEIVEQHYEAWQHGRHRVKPGLTGLWQVSARDDIPMFQNTELDITYVERMSFRLDCRILLATLKVVFGRLPGF